MGEAHPGATHFLPSRHHLRAAGDAATAVVFLQHASRLDPDNEFFRAVLLDVLKTADPREAATRAEAILQNSETHGPIVVLYAADTIFAAARGMSGLEAAATYRRLIPIMERTLARLERRQTWTTRRRRVSGSRCWQLVTGRLETSKGPATTILRDSTGPK